MQHAGTEKIGPAQYRALFSSFVGWMFDGYETSTLILVGASAVSALAAAVNPGEVRMMVGTALGSTLLGWAVGGMIGSIFADYIGRKKMLMIAIAGYCSLTALTAFSNSVEMLIALRFLTGMFLGSEWSTGTALVAEVWPRHARAKALGVMQSGYGFGFFLAAGLWLLIQPLSPDAWRWMFLVGVLPAISLIYIRRRLPESELWLKATSAIPPGRREFTLFEVFRDPTARLRMIGTLILASVTVSVFYSISALIAPFVGAIAAKQGLVAAKWASISVLVYNAGAIVAYILAGFVAEAFGRKTYMAIIFCASIFSGVLIYFMPLDIMIVLPCIFILGMSTLGVFSWMPIYLPELFATKVRSTASGFVFNLSRLISFPIPIVTAFLFSQLGGFQPTVLCLTGLYVVSLATLYFLPETKDKPLPM